MPLTVPHMQTSRAMVDIGWVGMCMRDMRDGEMASGDFDVRERGFMHGRIDGDVDFCMAVIQQLRYRKLEI